MIKTALLWLSAPALSVFASPLSFDFVDPAGINQVRFQLEAPLEPLVGTAAGVVGVVSFDPANAEATSGRIAVAAATLRIPNERMQGSVHGPDGIDVARYPEISFDVLRVTNVRRAGDEIVAEVTGNFALRGIVKEITVPVTFSHLPGALGRRRPGATGDLLVLRAEFVITREEFGLRPGQYLDKVSNEIRISLAIAGAAARRRPHFSASCASRTPSFTSSPSRVWRANQKAMAVAARPQATRYR